MSQQQPLTTFPKRSQLWRGVVMATIAHAIWVAQDPEEAYSLSWEGMNYSRQDGSGTRGTITFAEDRLVAVFSDDNSPRTPWRKKGAYDLDNYLNGIPDDLLALARAEALQYVLDDYQGVVQPIITTAFWGYGEDLTAPETCDEVVEHGAHLIRIELLEDKAALEALQENFEWDEPEMGLLTRLFYRHMQKPTLALTLADSDMTILTANGDAGLSESRALLAAINIQLPDQP